MLLAEGLGVLRGAQGRRWSSGSGPRGGASVVSRPLSTGARPLRGDGAVGGGAGPAAGSLEEAGKQRRRLCHRGPGEVRSPGAPVRVLRDPQTHHTTQPSSSHRTFLAFPCTKVYFSHMDLRPGSAQVRTHGQKVAAALTLAADHLDNLPSTLSALGDLHTTRLRVDPAHFRVSARAGVPGPGGRWTRGAGVPMMRSPQLLGHCLLVTLVRHFPGDFSPALQLAVDKFLDHVISALTSGREVPVVE